jgi:F-box/WD-40 domain protein 7
MPACACAQLYTGSNDATVRVWDCPGGTCASVVDVGGRVDSLLLEGDFLFVGLHVPGVQPPPGLIRVRMLLLPI